MIKRALQDITNVKSKNIKLTIKKEEKHLRREILPPFLAYVKTFYEAYDRPIAMSEYAPESTYIGEVTSAMRKTLVEWMYEVKSEFKMHSATFQVGVRILDAYTQEVSTVERRKIQLLGCTALFIAHKVFEQKRRRLSAFIDVCDHAYSGDEFVLAEREILRMISFNVNYLLPMHIIKEDHTHAGNALCAYASEAILLNSAYSHMAPSKLAVYIEKNVLSAVSSGRVCKDFQAALSHSETMLAQQGKSVRDVVSSL
ncbi:cyclin B [Nematocida displodere]|uniref:Cyclin B n=1 Tax=Nematocida displodere TaxID=1805483 RepID=A0A177EDV2_9MICR|nr:cyclin B [Nematocida displodere]